MSDIVKKIETDLSEFEVIEISIKKSIPYDRGFDKERWVYKKIEDAKKEFAQKMTEQLIEFINISYIENTTKPEINFCASIFVTKKIKKQ